VSVCVSVVRAHNSKTNDPKVFKLGTGNDLGISHKRYGSGVERSTVKVTGSQSAKRIECDRVASVSLHSFECLLSSSINSLRIHHLSLSDFAP